jgi:hypothetical protein
MMIVAGLDRLKRIDDDRKEERTGFSRRTFLVASAVTGGGMLLGVYLPRTIGAKAQASGETLAPNAFVRIRQHHYPRHAAGGDGAGHLHLDVHAHC